MTAPEAEHAALVDLIELGALAASWALTTAMSFAIVIRDERRLAPERRSRAWPAASRDCALVAFGQIAIVVHFVRTRRTVWSPLLGLAAALLATLPSLVLDLVLDALLPSSG